MLTVVDKRECSGSLAASVYGWTFGQTAYIHVRRDQPGAGIENRSGIRMTVRLPLKQYDGIATRMGPSVVRWGEGLRGGFGDGTAHPSLFHGGPLLQLPEASACPARV